MLDFIQFISDNVNLTATKKVALLDDFWLSSPRMFFAKVVAMILKSMRISKERLATFKAFCVRLVFSNSLSSPDIRAFFTGLLVGVGVFVSRYLSKKLMSGFYGMTLATFFMSFIPKASVNPFVFKVTNNHKVFNVVVKTIVVNVMDFFRWFKFSTNRLFHNITMFHYPVFAINCDSFVFTNRTSSLWPSYKFKGITMSLPAMVVKTTPAPTRTASFDDPVTGKNFTDFHSYNYTLREGVCQYGYT